MDTRDLEGSNRFDAHKHIQMGDLVDSYRQKGAQDKYQDLMLELQNLCFHESVLPKPGLETNQESRIEQEYLSYLKNRNYQMPI